MSVTVDDHLRLDVQTTLRRQFVHYGACMKQAFSADATWGTLHCVLHVASEKNLLKCQDRSNLVTAAS